MFDFLKRETDSRKKTVYESPYTMITILSLLIFFSEMAVMAAFPLFFETHHSLTEIFFDSFFLLILLSPSLYFLLLRPSIRQLEEKRHIELKLKDSHKNLEKMIDKKIRTGRG